MEQSAIALEDFRRNTASPRLPVLRRIDPYLPIQIENSRYLLKTVDQVSEFHEVLELRAKIFSEEYGVDLNSTSLDIDLYDFQCDHLIIIDKLSNTIVGTYRLLCSRFTQKFYSESEFEIHEFLEAPGTKLELGRACISKNHRKGAVLSLLWRGIVRYAILSGSDYLFGCSSVKTESPSAALNIMQMLQEENALSAEWKVRPKNQYRIPNLFAFDPSQVEIEIPSLFRSYLSAGAKVLGEPAHDPEFHCLDFFTVLRLTEITTQYEKRYQS